MLPFIPPIWVGYVLITIAFFLLVSKLFHPYHRIIALVSFLLSSIPFFYALAQYQEWIIEQSAPVTTIAGAHTPHIIIVTLLIILFYIIWTLIPFTPSPLRGMTKKEILTSLTEDSRDLLSLSHRIDLIFEHIDHETLLKKEAASVTTKDRAQLKDAWNELVLILFEIDLIKNKYRGFTHILFSDRRKYHVDAFHLAFGAFVTQYAAMVNLQKRTAGLEHIKKILNETANEETQTDKNLFDAFLSHLTNADELLRLVAGNAYFSQSKKRAVKTKKVAKLITDKQQIISSSLPSLPLRMIKRPLYFFEKLSFTFWFPIQKGATYGFGLIRTSQRPYFISPQIAQKTVHPKVQPGDIFLERRNWHAVNVGIPGFWPHAALYTGTLKEMDDYFSDIPQTKGTTASALIKDAYPEVYRAYKKKDEKGFPYRVIEVKRPGVSLYSLEESVNADSLAIVRPRSSKKEIFNTLMRSFQYHNRPYDYDFSFVSDEALVCTELIHKSFQENPDVTFSPTMANGRLLMTPNDIIKKFDEEYETKKQQLDFVLFLDANEKSQSVDVKDEMELRESWKRPKWYIFTS